MEIGLLILFMVCFYMQTFFFSTDISVDFFLKKIFCDFFHYF